MGGPFNPDLDYEIVEGFGALPKMKTDSLSFQAYVRNNWTDDHYENDLKSLFIMATGYAGETGEVVELLKKHVRDGRDIKADLLLELGDQLHYFVRIAQRFGFTLEEIMDANIVKLDERFGRKDG